jgi:ankyrin repeat protein
MHLIDIGANLKARDNEGMTALHLASAEGHISTLQYLCKNGANVKSRNDKGKPPYIWPATLITLQVRIL